LPSRHAARWRFARYVMIRPTPDRVRETLFNWLRDGVSGARCLDLYAGSGALGLEALSRGAASVVFVESAAAAARALRALLAAWQGDGVVVSGDALSFLDGPARAFDLVFVDPPFDAGLLAPTCARLAAGRWLAPNARIYLEHARREALPDLPTGWRELRAGTAGEVGYHLFASGPG
jgi:16S rRNA (guanine966-N2)-methyltransferase